MSYDETTDRPESPPPDTDERELRELLRSAGPRSELPREDLAEIEEAARNAWRERYVAGGVTSRTTSRRTVWALAASVVVALLAIWIWRISGPVEPVRVAEVEVVTGTAHRITEQHADGRALARGEELLAPGELRVVDGVVALRMTGGESVRLASSTRVQALGAERLELLRGELYVDSDPSAGGSDLEIVTRSGTVRELGTQYQVHLDAPTGSLRVAVREGAVAVTDGDEIHEAKAGESLTLAPDGGVVREAIAKSGPLWEWVTEAFRPIEIEGKSLAEFLAWVSRETGWEVRFTDPDLEAAARDIRLHGSVEDLRPEEAVEVIVAGSGLEHRFEAGVLEIRRPAEADTSGP